MQHSAGRRLLPDTRPPARLYVPGVSVLRRGLCAVAFLLSFGSDTNQLPRSPKSLHRRGVPEGGSPAAGTPGILSGEAQHRSSAGSEARPLQRGRREAAGAVLGGGASAAAAARRRQGLFIARFGDSPSRGARDGQGMSVGAAVREPRPGLRTRCGVTLRYLAFSTF